MNVVGRSLLAVTNRSTVRKLFAESSTGRRLSLRFVAGETLDEAAAAARKLNEAGAQVSLDHLGEHVADTDAAAEARDDYLECLDRIHADRLDANISVKLTQLGLGLNDDLAVESLRALAARAAEGGGNRDGRHGGIGTRRKDGHRLRSSPVRVRECSGSRCRATSIGRRPIWTGSLSRGGHVRLCKGAYAEPAEVAHQDPDRVDAAFDALTRRLMATPGVAPAIATHDMDRIELAKQLGERRSESWEFQMLYGVRTNLQRSLVEDGYPLRVYVPYGTAWYPYLTRRMAERPANLAFFLRAAAGR